MPTLFLCCPSSLSSHGIHPLGHLDAAPEEIPSAPVWRSINLREGAKYGIAHARFFHRASSTTTFVLQRARPRTLAKKENSNQRKAYFATPCERNTRIVKLLL